ncbi:MAG: radical SAM protein [Bacteroidales bacterium]|jgi:wyosine [tRNA(Phe)-imidazoG37] synthetase (radical SAM superfamily)|nr:radical SAM protein [Bacteroidales bacterium]
MLFESIVFGPISSRRLGVSLGVNLLPTEKKYCSFNCIYCECGWNQIDTKVDVPLNKREDVKAALKMRLESNSEQENAKINSITFSGNGEPTIHPDILGIVNDVIELRNQYCPQAKITILSNSTNLVREDVFEALQKIDNPILKLDSGTEEMYNRINKPVSAKFDTIIDRLKAFGGKCIIQTLLLRGENEGKVIDNTSEEEFEAWLGIVKEIKPRSVMLYSIDRETPEKELEKLLIPELERYAERVRQLGIETNTY